jgi:type II pantothenate kinase
MDFGLTNIDVVIQDSDKPLQLFTLPNGAQPLVVQLECALQTLGYDPANFERIAVTGGQHRSLPPRIGSTPIVGVSEVAAIGRGGLHLTGLEQALVVSAGSGTAMVAARAREARHVTGSAVGGGTLQGLGRLLLGVADAREIDDLAQRGDANVADLTLAEVLGATVGSLPVDANAVNFGRLAQQEVALLPEDMAAALVRMVGQVIAVIAINATRAERLDSTVVIGHLADLSSVCRVLHTVAGYYSTTITIPLQPGYGTAIGALLCTEI